MTRTLVVKATAEKIDAVHRALEKFWTDVARKVASYDPGVRLGVDTAVAELASNIVRHAYPSSDAPGTMCLNLRFYSDRVEVTLTDHGIPYKDSLRNELHESPDLSGETTQLLPERGRGLGVAFAAVDELRYHRTAGGRNRWKLAKSFKESHA